MPEDFTLFINQFTNLKHLSISFMGESLLNKHLFEIFEITASKDIYSEIDTNVCIQMSDEFIDNFIRSGLSCLQASIDGASQESYEAYRVGGRFALVFNNLKRLRIRQLELGGIGPKLNWKYIVNAYNEHEVDLAKNMAADIDVDIKFAYYELPDDCPDVDMTSGALFTELREKWLPRNAEYLLPRYKIDNPALLKRLKILKGPCPWLFEYVVIHTDGSVLPCCYTASERSSMGNMKDQELEAIWYSHRYQYARSLFLKTPEADRLFSDRTDENELSVPCKRCNLYARKRS